MTNEIQSMLKDFLETNKKQQPNHLKDKAEIIAITTSISKSGKNRNVKFFTINNNQMAHITYHFANLLSIKYNENTHSVTLKNFMTDEDAVELVEKILNIGIRVHRIL